MKIHDQFICAISAAVVAVAAVAGERKEKENLSDGRIVRLYILRLSRAPIDRAVQKESNVLNVCLLKFMFSSVFSASRRIKSRKLSGHRYCGPPSSPSSPSMRAHEHNNNDLFLDFHFDIHFCHSRRSSTLVKIETKLADEIGNGCGFVVFLCRLVALQQYLHEAFRSRFDALPKVLMNANPKTKDVKRIVTKVLETR